MILIFSDVYRKIEFRNLITTSEVFKQVIIIIFIFLTIYLKECIIIIKMKFIIFLNFLIK
jgi:hypothetical protein